MIKGLLKLILTDVSLSRFKLTHACRLWRSLVTERCIHRRPSWQALTLTDPYLTRRQYRQTPLCGPVLVLTDVYISDYIYWPANDQEVSHGALPAGGLKQPPDGHALAETYHNTSVGHGFQVFHHFVKSLIGRVAGNLITGGDTESLFFGQFFENLNPAFAIVTYKQQRRATICKWNTLYDSVLCTRIQKHKNHALCILFSVVIYVKIF